MQFLKSTHLCLINNLFDLTIHLLYSNRMVDDKNRPRIKIVTRFFKETGNDC